MMLSLDKRVLLVLFAFVAELAAQKLLPFKLPDTGQSTSFSTVTGEDAQVILNPISLTDNGDGTITDNNTGLMWQKTDAGEKTWAAAALYCENLVLAGYGDWRLPTSHELFSINHYDYVNPALSIAYFTKTLAEYWWSSDLSKNDSSKVWVVNAGGGIGNHPKTETVSAGGSKRFHVRAVRNPYATVFSVQHFVDNQDGTVTDGHTGLVWQKMQSPNTMTWEDALRYSANLSLAGKADWRLPNIKELQSLNDERLAKPSIDNLVFSSMTTANFWSSTTLVQQPARAWDLNTEYGVVSYHDKSARQSVLCVRGGSDKSDLHLTEVTLPGGEYEMGDHYGFVDPSHPSDELPIHKVKVGGFIMATTETTNEQFLAFLNASLLQKRIEIRENGVYLTASSTLVCYTHQYAPYYSIGYDGKDFVLADFRASHPVVGVMWIGAALYCNWLSEVSELAPCYDVTSWACDFTKNGYRLPTEAEWEYAARGGQYNPYYNYPWGNGQDISRANWPESKDPYEGSTESSYPHTTPVGFYDGALHLKADYNWPGSAGSYQTLNGANAFGLFDMAGNVWEFVNDWYGQNYYSVTPYTNPKGPDAGFIMPDGKPYRGMRGGNWYNGYKTTAVNDGHSRVSNRNPSYYRGPQDPNHPWYHVGFRICRNDDHSSTGVKEAQSAGPDEFALMQNFPNPFNPVTLIPFSIETAGHVTLKVFNAIGQELATLVDQPMAAGHYQVLFDGRTAESGILFCRLTTGKGVSTKKMILIK
jgi:formylglycine-generating enzyme required for sulfatase activity